jgi:ribosomal protein S12
MTSPLSTNANDLVAVSVAGNIAHPGFPGLPAEPYRLASDGTAFLLPTYGGIVYNVSVGDRAFGWAADCIHPGISIRQAEDTRNRGLNVYSCIGNRARVMTGQAAGTAGVVTGKSGRFSEQVIVHFPKAARARMAVGDQVTIRSEGIGMVLSDHPAVMLKGIAPELLAALPHRVVAGRVDFGVVATVPAHLIGAGLGLTSEGGSLHLQSTDKAELARHGLDALRLGDIVALADTDSRFNHGYLRGARAIGVVCAGDGPRAGFGPGIAILMTAPAGELGSFDAPGTNIVDLLGLEP